MWRQRPAREGRGRDWRGCSCEPRNAKATRSGDSHSWQKTWDPFLFQCPKKVFAQQGGGRSSWVWENDALIQLKNPGWLCWP